MMSPSKHLIPTDSEGCSISPSESQPIRVLGIVPARGGSKGLPRKNVLRLGDAPLIVHTIRTGQSAHSISRLVVSTEDREIADISKAATCTVVPRPVALARDESLTVDVVADVLRQLAEAGELYDIVVLLQPTCPFRSACDIDGSVAVLLNGSCDSVVSVTGVGEYRPERMYQARDGLLVSYAEEPPSRRRQDLPELFVRNGAVYVTWVEAFRSSHSLLSGRLAPFMMPRSRSINIDDEHDLQVARALLAARTDE